jgi:hypothetical protein
MSALILTALLLQATPPVDARTLELLREECRSRIAVREVVYFANGTVRLREGPSGELTVSLGELGGNEANELREQLAGVDLAALEVVSTAPDGDWVDRCRVRLTLVPGTEREITYSPLDAGSLELEKLRRLVDFLVSVARRGAGSIEIPAGYSARPGDRLERADGAVFEVVGFTSDGRAVELVSNDPPVTMFVERERLRFEFRRLLGAPDRP